VSPLKQILYPCLGFDSSQQVAAIRQNYQTLRREPVGASGLGPLSLYLYQASHGHIHYQNQWQNRLVLVHRERRQVQWHQYDPLAPRLTNLAYGVTIKLRTKMDAVGYVPAGVEYSNVVVMGVGQEGKFAEPVPVAPAFQRLKQWQLQVKGLSIVYGR
jgi:hypothetical protein